MPASNPLVSVLMTAYNREKYIAEAIESVLASTYQNFELIIVDDCSTDGTVNIAKSFEAKDERIKVYINKQNLGDYSNRNEAAGFAKGVYIKYLDSDDVIYPYGLGTMVNAMELFTEAGMGFSPFRHINYKLPFILTSIEAYREHFFKGGLLYNGPTGAIYRKDFFEKIGKFNPEYNVAADYDFNLRASLHKPVVIFQRDLVWWRQHDEQEINLKDNQYEKLNYRINEYYLNNTHCPLPIPERRIAFNNAKNLLSRNILTSIKKTGVREALYKYRKYGVALPDVLLSVLPSSVRRKFQKIN